MGEPKQKPPEGKSPVSRKSKGRPHTTKIRNRRSKSAIERDIFREVAAGSTQKEVGERYGFSQNTVSDIVRRVEKRELENLTEFVLGIKLDSTRELKKIARLAMASFERSCKDKQRVTIKAGAAAKIGEDGKPINLINPDALKKKP